MPYLAGENSPTSDTSAGSALARQNAKDKGKKKKNSLKNYLLTDEDYLNATAGYKRNWKSARNELNRNLGDLKSDYGTTTDRLQQDQDLDTRRMMQDYASRGMLMSGIYQNAQTLRDQDYTQQRDDASDSYLRNQLTLNKSKADAKDEFSLNMANARLAAIRRRAAKLGLRK